MPYSAAFIELLNSSETEEIILPLIKLSSAGWVDDIRLVGDTLPLTHNSEVYLPYPFEINLPDQGQDGSQTVVQFRASSVDQIVTQEIFTATDDIDVELRVVLKSSPDTTEIGPMKLQLREVSDDGATLSGQLGLSPILDRLHGIKTFNPSLYPGLF